MTLLESDVDLVAPEAVADPHRVFARQRQEGPVWWLRRHKAWLLLGYDDVREALSDQRLSTDTAGTSSQIADGASAVLHPAASRDEHRAGRLRPGVDA